MGNKKNDFNDEKFEDWGDSENGESMTLESNYFIEESEETCFKPIIYDIETKRNKENNSDDEIEVVDF